MTKIWLQPGQNCFVRYSKLGSSSTRTLRASWYHPTILGLENAEPSTWHIPRVEFAATILHRNLLGARGVSLQSKLYTESCFSSRRQRCTPPSAKDCCSNPGKCNRRRWKMVLIPKRRWGCDVMLLWSVLSSHHSLNQVYRIPVLCGKKRLVSLAAPAEW